MKTKLPKKTEQYINDTVRKLNHIKKRYASSKMPYILYREDYTDPSYGFEDMIRNGNYCPLPTYSDITVQCFTNAVYKYFVAKKLGLNPRFFSAYGFRKCDEARKVGKKAKEERNSLENKLEELSDKKENEDMDHSFIDVIDPSTKRREIIDNLMGNYGFVKYDEKKNKILVKGTKGTGMKETIKYNFMVQLDEEELIKRIKFLQSDIGAIKMLETGQRLGTYPINKSNRIAVYSRFNPEENELEIQIQSDFPMYMSRGIKNIISYDQHAKKKKETIDFSYFMKADWMRLSNVIQMGSLPLKDVKAIWKIAEKIFSAKYKNPSSFIRKTFEDKVIKEMNELCGSDEFFSQKSIEKIAEKAKKDEACGIGKEELEDLAAISEKISENFKKSMTDEFSRKVLIFGYNTETAYKQEVEKRKNEKTDFEGHIYPEKERYAIIDELRRKMVNFKKTRKYLGELIDENFDKTQPKWKNLTKKKLIKALRNVDRKEAKYEAEYQQYGWLLRNHADLFNKHRDRELAEKEIRPVKNELDEMSEKNPEEYLKRHEEGLFDKYCLQMQRLSLVAYQSRKYLELKGLLPLIEPKIKTYLKSKQEEK
jgi:hypothetical protein